MSVQEQLEIIGPAGEVEFYDLASEQGVINIGRHPENDVVLSSPNIALFHAVLDYRRRPYQIVVLDQQGQTMLDGQLLLPNVSTELCAWDTLQVDGFSIILLQDAVAPVATLAPPQRPSVPTREPAPQPLPVDSAPAAPRPGLPVAPIPAPEISAPALAPALAALAPATTPASMARPVGLAARPLDRDDAAIITEISEREWVLDVEQSANCQLTIINGGAVVAAFRVYVEGVHESWVTLSAPQVYLNEGEQETINITISPPRNSSSRAGAHHLAVVVTSPNHQGSRSQKGATLVINPYYEFAVGELSPKQQTVSWRKRFGETVLPIANRGNSEGLFHIEAQDDERACHFEFQVPGEATSLARQAEVRLPPEETFAIPVQITPQSRRLVGLRKRAHSFTVTASLPEGQQTPRSVIGRLTSKPLIGPWLIALMLFSLAVLVILIFRPRIYEFEGDLRLVKIGESVTLNWRASTFSNLKLYPDLGSVEGPKGEKTVTPENDVVYRLRAENFLSRLSPAWFSEEELVVVEVEPVEPEIALFRATKSEIVRGQESTILVWNISDADQLTILASPPDVDFGDRVLLAADPQGQYEVWPLQETHYTLEVVNNKSGLDATHGVQVMVIEPTPIPVPPPVIEFFQVEPERVAEGEDVLLSWTVTGDPDRVEISGIGDVQPVGPHTHKLEKEGTVSFWLTAYKDGVDPVRQLRNVVVDAAPILPRVVDFSILPSEIVRNNGKDVKLSWLVSGDVSKIEIHGLESGLYTTVQITGSIQVMNASRSTNLTLMAFGMNEGESDSKTISFTVLEPTLTPTPMPTSTPTPPTATPTPTPPLPIISYFNAESGNTPPQTEDVTFLSKSDDESPTFEYAVKLNSLVLLSWSVQNAVKVELDGLGQPTTGSKLIMVDGAKTYPLIAENVDGKTAGASLAIKLKEPVPPPPPSNLRGMQSSQSVTLTWSHPNQYVNDIIGFRIYRAPVPPGVDFVPMESIDDPLARSWIDTTTPVCDQAYYVVVLYYDVVAKEEKETGVSSPSWFSGTCATTP